jgi:hypothetical protein
MSLMKSRQICALQHSMALMLTEGPCKLGAVPQFDCAVRVIGGLADFLCNLLPLAHDRVKSSRFSYAIRLIFDEEVPWPT